MENPPEPLPTIEEIRAMVRELDPTLFHADNIFKALVVLLVLGFGAAEFNLESICAFTGYSPKRGIVQKFMANMDANGIYRDGSVWANWTDEYSGEIALLLDALTTNGEIERVSQS